MRRKPALRWRRRLLRGARASVALEFALIGPVLVLFLGAAADFGFAVYCRSRLAAAVSAGAEYAVLTGTGVSQTNVRSVVANVAALGLPSGDPAVSVTKYCIQTSPPQLVQNSTTCPDGSTPRTFAVITATYTPELLVPIQVLIGGLSITETAAVELQQ